jgi:hypothetical protein
MLFFIPRAMGAPVEHWCDLAVLFSPMYIAEHRHVSDSAFVMVKLILLHSPEMISRDLAFVLLMVRPLGFGRECRHCASDRGRSRCIIFDGTRRRPRVADKSRSDLLGKL